MVRSRAQAKWVGQVVVDAPPEDLSDLPPACWGDWKHAVRVAHVRSEKEYVFAGGCEGAGAGDGCAHVSHCGAAWVGMP